MKSRGESSGAEPCTCGNRSWLERSIETLSPSFLHHPVPLVTCYITLPLLSAHYIPMSTYTPCFPLLSSTSSGTSISGGNAPKASFSARLSRAHLALASVSDYIERPPSPTSAAVDRDRDRVVKLHRKFRLAVAAAYRDTSSGKWAHVFELARLGCTIGRWQGVCSGRTAPRILCPPSTGDRNDQGELFK